MKTVNTWLHLGKIIDPIVPIMLGQDTGSSFRYLHFHVFYAVTETN